MVLLKFHDFWKLISALLRLAYSRFEPIFSKQTLIWGFSMTKHRTLCITNDTLVSSFTDCFLFANFVYFKHTIYNCTTVPGNGILEWVFSRLKQSLVDEQSNFSSEFKQIKLKEFNNIILKVHSHRTYYSLDLAVWELNKYFFITWTSKLRSVMRHGEEATQRTLTIVTVLQFNKTGFDQKKMCCNLYVVKQFSKTGDQQYCDTSTNGEYSLGYLM